LDADLLVLLDPRSLRAQPLPLKWNVGGVNAFFMGAPHLGHSVGPWPWTEWTTSMRWPQLVQT
jgi:hypothetical protein